MEVANTETFSKADGPDRRSEWRGNLKARQCCRPEISFFNR